MNITFIGVGEACDPLLPNTSLLVESGGKRLLLDCGFTTPHHFFRQWPGAEDLDFVWISHFHGDHFFGLPLLILQYKVLGRQAELVIAGPRGLAEKVTTALELAYPGLGQDLGFALCFIELEPGHDRAWAGLALATAENIHSQRSLSLRISDPQHSLVYSGDGKATSASLELALGVDIMVHESFWLERQDPGHGNVVDCLAHAQAAQVKQLALVHICAEVRHNRASFARLMTMIETTPLSVTVPLPGEKLKCL